MPDIGYRRERSINYVSTELMYDILKKINKIIKNLKLHYSLIFSSKFEFQTRIFAFSLESLTKEMQNSLVVSFIS